MNSQIKYTTLSTGIAVEYIEFGARGGTPLLLLHGLSDSWHSFLPLLPFLPEDIRALAFSQRGHGQSGKPRSGYALDSLVRDAVAFLDAMRIDRAVIAGHSMGAAVAALLAARHPHRVASLGLLGAFADFRFNAGVIELKQDAQRLVDPIDPDFARAFQASTIIRMDDDEFLDLVVSDSQALPAFAWRALVDGLMTRELPAAFGRIVAPTFLVWGDGDVFIPRADQELMETSIRNAKLHVLRDTGHAVHWDRPAETAALIETLMRQTKAPVAA